MNIGKLALRDREESFINLNPLQTGAELLLMQERRLYHILMDTQSATGAKERFISPQNRILQDF